MAVRVVLYSVMAALVAYIYITLGFPDPLDGVWASWRQGNPDKPTVVLVVMDTVRADHTSVCGYERPNTPGLQRLVDEEGASLACHAYAPGSWTMPSHASFFTGATVPEHGVHFVPTGEGLKSIEESIGFSANPLDDRLPTIAEHYRELGYQTASISANPLIDRHTGLARGFEHVEVHSKEGWSVVRQVRRLLRWTIAPDKPLFLFVNVVDAHEPWGAIPSGVGWVPPRPSRDFERVRSEFNLHDYFPDWYPQDLERRAFTQGEMAPEAKAQVIGHLTDVYDYGVYNADAAVWDIYEAIKDHGWAESGLRFIVTSDHGEQLGEHDLLAHGRYVWEPVTRVPLVVYDDTQAPPELPDTVSAIVVYDLLKSGVLPSPLPPVMSFAFGDDMWERLLGGGGRDKVAVWSDGLEKLIWKDGDDEEDPSVERYDLPADPGELHPLDVPVEHPLVPVLGPGVESLLKADRSKAEMSEDMLKALEAIGYLDEGAP